MLRHKHGWRRCGRREFVLVVSIAVVLALIHGAVLVALGQSHRKLCEDARGLLDEGLEADPGLLPLEAMDGVEQRQAFAHGGVGLLEGVCGMLVGHLRGLHLPTHLDLVVSCSGLLLAELQLVQARHLLLGLLQRDARLLQLNPGLLLPPARPLRPLGSIVEQAGRSGNGLAQEHVDLLRIGPEGIHVDADGGIQDRPWRELRVRWRRARRRRRWR
mmetsp:Transcript_18572/g.44065  ORF Transcript_18572/g.44065 Transcript_18572/m.44065 type:complete len:216 (+) Transcript_18572:75-722(+)